MWYSKKEVFEMKKVIKTIITTVKKLTNDEEFKSQHKSNEKDFIRTRTLTFQSVIFFVLGLVKTSLDFETINFSKIAKIESISASAISQARDKIQFTAFRELLIETRKLIPIINTFKKHRVIAVDGMQCELPNTSELTEQYMLSKGVKRPQFHAVAMFDVLNCCFIDATFMPAPTNERASAYELLKTQNNDEEQIYLFDRGFPSVALIQKLNKSNKKFVMRVSASFLREVNEFTKSKSLDKLIHIDYDKRRGQTNEVKEVELPYSFDLRCVRIELSSKITEILITNLPKSSFTRKDIGNLYGMRWGIETSFNHLKNAIHIEEFVGIKENSVKQEFFATLLKYNLFMLFIEEAEMVKRFSKKNFKI